MKKSIVIVFWVFSVSLGVMSLALLSASVLSCALLLGCAVLINPLFIEKVQLKKGLTALLAIGLFIGAVAVFPSNDAAAAQTPAVNTQVAREMPAEASASAGNTSEGTKGLQLIEESNLPEATLFITPTPPPKATPTQKPTPTQAPTLTPKPTLTPQPTPTDAPITRSAGITVVGYSESVRRNSFAFIEIQGAPNTEYTCEVEYKSGSSTADGLGTKRSDADGKVSWRWKVGPRTSLNYTPTIYITGGGDSVSVRFDVTE